MQPEPLDDNVTDDTLPPVSLEECLSQLDVIAAKIENNGITLDEAIAEFERGCRLAARAHTILVGAHARVEQVLARARNDAVNAS